MNIEKNLPFTEGILFYFIFNTISTTSDKRAFVDLKGEKNKHCLFTRIRFWKKNGKMKNRKEMTKRRNFDDAKRRLKNMSFSVKIVKANVKNLRCWNLK